MIFVGCRVAGVREHARRYYTVMAAQAGIAGSTKIGKNCQFGGQSAVAPHIQIADGVKVVPQAGIPNTIW